MDLVDAIGYVHDDLVATHDYPLDVEEAIWAFVTALDPQAAPEDIVDEFAGDAGQAMREAYYDLLEASDNEIRDALTDC